MDRSIALGMQVLEEAYRAELDKLKTENNRLREALGKITKGSWGPGVECIWCMYQPGKHLPVCPAEIAEEALK